MLKFNLFSPLDPYSSRYDERDVHMLKVALNRLGYYKPLKHIGIQEEREPAFYEALHKFQREKNLPERKYLQPFDTTIRAISDALRTQKLQGRYIWRTVKDDGVRDTHAIMEGQIYTWGFPPVIDHPGEDYNCRCWAEPIIEKPYPDAINPVYPELLLIPASKFGHILKIITSFFAYARNKNYTNHGALRSAQRKASEKEIQEAIRSAKESGNVTQKIGKYGTIQNHYHGSNGLTVIEETEGRNAGKIITLWWQK